MHGDIVFLVPRQHGHIASLSNQLLRRFIGSAGEHVQRVAELSLVGFDDVKRALERGISPLRISVRRVPPRHKHIERDVCRYIVNIHSEIYFSVGKICSLVS